MTPVGLRQEIARALTHAEAVVLAATAEAAIIALEADRGDSIPDATRPLSQVEVAAGVRFGRIAARADAAAAAMLTATDPVAAHILEQLRAQLATAGTVEEVQARTAAWASPVTADVLPGLSEQVQAAADAMAPVVDEVWRAAGEDLAQEAVHQGATPPPSLLPLTPAVLALATAAAAGIAAHRASRMLTAAANAARQTPAPGTSTSTPAVVAQVVVAAAATSTAGTLDLARQAAHQVESAARATQARAPGWPEIAEIYASELLDGNTCSTCASTDGTRFASLDDAHRVYRENGGHRECAGGLRCRGTLVIVYATETPPTLDTPYDRPTQQRPDAPDTPEPTPVDPDEPARRPAGGNATPPDAPIGPRERPSVDDLTAERVVQPDGDWSGYSADERAAAQLLKDEFGITVNVVKQRATQFPNVQRYKTPDAVDYVSWRTFEFKTATSIEQAVKRLQDGLRQSANIVMTFKTPTRPSSQDLAGFLDTLERRASPDRPLDSLVLLWDDGDGAVTRIV